MKLLISISIATMFLSGCTAIKGYIDPNGSKETVIYMVAGNQPCAENFYEVDGSVISGAGIVTDLVTTCGTVSDANLTCPNENVFCIRRNIIK